MTIPTRPLALTCLAVLLLTPATRADDAQFRVDSLKLTQFQRGIDVVSAHAVELTDLRQAQFSKLISDALAGDMAPEQTYLKPLSDIAARIVAEGESQLGEAMVARLRNTFARQDAEFVEHANAAILKRNALMTEVVDPVRASFTEPESPNQEPQLTLAVFNGPAQAMVAEIVTHGELLKQMRMERDRLEDFLVDSSRKIWEDLEDSQSKVYLPMTRRATIRGILRNYFVKHRYFDAEEPLRKACQKYGEKDKDSALHLLYAFVLLINESNPVATEAGFKHLEDAFDKLHTERLAYNLVRVGARLDRIDEDKLWKLIDHARYREDGDGLGNLYNLAMLRFVTQDNWAQADRLYEKLLRDDNSRALAPVFSFIVLLQQGAYDRLATEVRAETVDELMAAN